VTPFGPGGFCLRSRSSPNPEVGVNLGAPILVPSEGAEAAVVRRPREFSFEANATAARDCAGCSFSRIAIASLDEDDALN
jgi:hypothetical protein